MNEYEFRKRRKRQRPADVMSQIVHSFQKSEHEPVKKRVEKRIRNRKRLERVPSFSSSSSRSKSRDDKAREEMPNDVLFTVFSYFSYEA